MQLSRLLPHLLLTAVLANAVVAFDEPAQGDSLPSQVPSGLPVVRKLITPTATTPSPIQKPSLLPQPTSLTAVTSRKAVCSPNLDFPSYDIYNARGSPEDCFKMARGDARVTTFTWTNYNGGTCWLKAFSPIWQPSPGAISCRLDGEAMKFVESCDMPGSDIASKPYPSTVLQGSSALLAGPNNIKDCRQHCRADAGCYAVTWSDYNGGSCWLKNSPSVCKTNKNTYSLISLKPWFTL